MPTKPQVAVSSTNSQRDNRWVETVYDQHKCARFPTGRPWWGYLELPSDPKREPGFSSPLSPGDHNAPLTSSWGAPWMPLQVAVGGNTPKSYYKLDIKRLRITWNYHVLIADAKQATLDYYRAAAKIANANGWKAPGLNEPVSFQIASILLDPPLSPKIAEAALGGDPWILGETERVNEQLFRLLDVTAPRASVPTVSIDEALRIGEGDRDLDALVAEKVAQALAKMQAEKMRAGKKTKRRPAPAPAAA